MVTLAGLEPATSPAPGENKDALSPLSYGAVMILMTVCGGVRADTVPQRMSALPPKADIGTQSRNVRFVPKANIQPGTYRNGALTARATR